MNKELIEQAIKETGSMAGAAVKLGLSRYYFYKITKEMDLYKPNQSGKGISKKRTTLGKFKLSDVLEGKHPQYSTNHLKHRLLDEGVKEDKCEICGIEEWNGKKIVHQLDHINGNSRDHRLENLRVICPNCHSQTDTFCGKNK
jgi:hypothetical protein